MSPVRTRSVGVEAADGGGREVVAARGSAGNITITWFCGDQRSFEPDALAQAVKAVDLAQGHDDVWVELSDMTGRATFARVRDGQLYANTSAYEGDAVPWDDMKKALRRMAKEAAG